MRTTLTITAASALVLALAATPASASRPPRVPPPLPRFLAHRAPPGVHARVRRLPAGRGRTRGARRGLARAASLPPVTRLDTWSTGMAYCDAWVLQPSGLYAPGVHVSPPSLYESALRPGSNWLAYSWQAGVMWWDADRNQWVNGGTLSARRRSNPIDDFAYEVGGAIIDDGSWVIPRQRRYSYVWVQSWWHYGTYEQVSELTSGGTWYTGTHYLRQVGSRMDNLGCWWG